MEKIYYFVFQRHTVFMPLRYLYPECFFLIKGNDNLFPLLCCTGDCPANKNCHYNLIKRTRTIFGSVVTDSRLIILYYKYPKFGESLKAGIFLKNEELPRFTALNPRAFKYFRDRSKSFEWTPPSDFYLNKDNNPKKLITLP